MQLIFEQLFGGDGQPDTLVDLIEYQLEEQYRRYIDDVVKGTAAHAAELDAEIASCLRGWTLERISKVDHAILRLAVYEYRYTHLQAPVVISEAVILAETYSTQESARFINGVLGTITRKKADK